MHTLTSLRQFASVANKDATGPLERFAAMLTSLPFLPLWGHRQVHSLKRYMYAQVCWGRTGLRRGSWWLKELQLVHAVLVAKRIVDVVDPLVMACGCFLPVTM
jgi:hypothetical protein